MQYPGYFKGKQLLFCVMSVNYFAGQWTQECFTTCKHLSVFLMNILLGLWIVVKKSSDPGVPAVWFIMFIWTGNSPKERKRGSYIYQRDRVRDFSNHTSTPYPTTSYCMPSLHSVLPRPPAHESHQSVLWSCLRDWASPRRPAQQ